MNPRTASRLVWGWAALTLSLLAGGIALSGIAGSGESAVLVLPAVAFASVGGLVASRHPGNVIGWLFCLGALGAALQKFAEGYAEYGLARAALAGTEVAAWVASWIWLPWAFLVPTLMFVTFPHGRTDGGLRRLFARFSVALMVVTVLASAVTPGPLEGYPTVTNPFGIGGAVKTVTYVVGLGGMLLSLVALVLSAATLVRRYRRSMGVERQQIKWLGFAAIVLGLTIAISFSLYLLDLPLAEIGPLLVVLALMGLPVAAGIAILRYRLYDIDLIINKTLVYASLTITLGLAYLGTVVVIQRVLSPLAGGSDLAVAGSTLAVAALFRPLRSRIQGFIDRRFYRRKYDAAKTVEAFTARLRDEIDLDTLRYELTEVVREAMQPAHVGLWLRSGEPLR